MKIAIFGAGALGSLMGGLLSTKHEVTLVGRKPHTDAVNDNGLEISGVVEKTFHVGARTETIGMSPQDVVLITVKAYDTEEASRSIAPMVDSDTIVVSLQNGLDNVATISQSYPSRTVGGVTSSGATFLAPGRIRFAGRGETVFGSSVGRRDLAEMVCDAFNECGIDSRVTDDITAEVWMKVIVNASINPITALVASENACIEDEPDLRKLAETVCSEAEAVAKASGVRLPRCNPFGKVMSVVAATRNNRSSMLQDVEASRRTEIDEINGAIVTEAMKHGVSVPANETLWRLVRCLNIHSERNRKR
ncbi:MAG: 2-dehydropantoate 2-reductase [Methanomassiliicoccales archaeon]|nr:2-dehydropantoate 2-reductase [Methanomassiliicoccales archaeon]